MSRNYFGTDGIRGPFGTPPLTPEFFFRLGRASFRFFAPASNDRDRPVLLVARDTRSSGVALEEAFVRGLEASGGRSIRLGVLPTASVSATILEQGADAGAMISASHNPHQDNGIKFFDARGFKLNDESESQLETMIDAIPGEPVSLTVPGFQTTSLPEAKETYFKVLRQSVPKDFSLEGWRIIVDAAHGAAFETTPQLLGEFGAEVQVLGGTPDGTNINDQCGSQHPEKAAQAVGAYHRASPEIPVLGLCHDGDADRLVLIDENGSVLDGDEILAICATDAAQARKLSGNGVVATVMSNLGLDECLQNQGLKIVRTPVGDRYVLEAMLREEISIGGEQSGHTLFLDHLPTGDGLLTALQVLQAVRASGQSLGSLRRCMQKYPQKLFNLSVTEKKPIEEIPEAAAAIREVESALGDTGRVFFRYSGTENKARLLIEAREGRLIDPAAEKILSPLRAAIGQQ